MAILNPNTLEEDTDDRSTLELVWDEEGYPVVLSDGETLEENRKRLAHLHVVPNFPSTTNLTSQPDSLAGSQVGEFNGAELANRDEDLQVEYLPLLGQEGWVVLGWSNLVSGYPRAGKTDLLLAAVCEWLDAK